MSAVLWMAKWWLISMATFWMSLGLALYLDIHRSAIREVCADWRLLSLKILFAPFSIAYLLVVVACQPLVVLWRNFAIGCFTGRSAPFSFLGSTRRSGRIKLSQLRAQRDVARAEFEKDREMYGKPDAPVPPAVRELSCSDSFVRNEAATREGCDRSGGRPRILIDDEFAERYAPQEDEEDPPRTVIVIPGQEA